MSKTVIFDLQCTFNWKHSSKQKDIKNLWYLFDLGIKCESNYIFCTSCRRDWSINLPQFSNVRGPTERSIYRSPRPKLSLLTNIGIVRWTSFDRRWPYFFESNLQFSYIIKTKVKLLWKRSISVFHEFEKGNKWVLNKVNSIW